jgi:hypothetical protein
MVELHLHLFIRFHGAVLSLLRQRNVDLLSLPYPKIFRDDYNLRNSSLCSFIHISVTSSLLGQNNLLGAFLKHSLSIMFHP